MRRVRVVCDAREHCGQLLRVLYGPPGTYGPDPAYPERIREHGERLPCGRCGTNHEIRTERFDAAYRAAAAAPRPADRVIRLPLPPTR